MSSHPTEQNTCLPVEQQCAGAASRQFSVLHRARHHCRVSQREGFWGGWLQFTCETSHARTSRDLPVGINSFRSPYQNTCFETPPLQSLPSRNPALPLHPLPLFWSLNFDRRPTKPPDRPLAPFATSPITFFDNLGCLQKQQSAFDPATNDQYASPRRRRNDQHYRVIRVAVAF